LGRSCQQHLYSSARSNRCELLQFLAPTILASLVPEDPLLLVGRSGTGKTFLLNTFSEALDPALAALYGLETRRLRRIPKLDVAICDIKVGSYSRTTACVHGARRHPVLVPAAISDLTRRFLELDRLPSRSIVARSKGLRPFDGRPAKLDRDSLKSEDARRHRTLPVATASGKCASIAGRGIGSILRAPGSIEF